MISRLFRKIARYTTVLGLGVLLSYGTLGTNNEQVKPLHNKREIDSLISINNNLSYKVGSLERTIIIRDFEVSFRNYFIGYLLEELNSEIFANEFLKKIYEDSVFLEEELLPEN